MKRLIYVLLAAVLLLAGTAAAQASVQPQTGTAVANNSIKSKHIKNGTIKKRDLNKKLYDRLLNDDTATDNDDVTVNAPKGDTGATGATGPAGPQGAPGVTNLESDGPYPGATNLVDGDNSTSYWAGDGTLQRSWVQCPPGKLALGGGFTLAADASLADKLAARVLTSAPVQIESGNPDTYNPIAGDVDGSFRPNGWLVEGVYNGSNPVLIVRPHVICANVG